VKQGRSRVRDKARLRLMTVVAATLVWLALGIPAPIAAAQQSAPIQVFQSLSSFSTATRVTQITFDDYTTGTALGNPVSLGPVSIQHSTAVTFKTNADAYVPVSSPNVLAPFQADGTLTFGTTTLTFANRTRASGLFLIIPRGSNQDAIWTSTVTATDAGNHNVTATVTFRGAIGEQQFIGFKSRLRLVSIAFSPATKPDASSVVALDNVMIG
jgi:hypothetical protein